MIKKGIVMSIGLSSVALAMSSTDVHASQTGIVTTDVLNVRSGPATTHSVIGKLYKGNTVEILQTSNGWHQVKLSNGKIGWSSGDYISKSSSNDSDSSLGYGIVNTSALNVRSGAGTNYSIIGKIYKNDKVELLSSSNGWYKIKLSNGTVGFSSSTYIDKTSSSNSNSPNLDSSNQSSLGYGIVNTSALNVRDGAGTNYSIIAKVYKNNKVEILSSSNGWYKIRLSDGTIGWSSSEYITKTNSGDQGSSDNNGSIGESSLGYGVVNTSALNVRSGAGTNHSIITKVYKNDKVELISNSNGWYKVKLSNGTIGWVSSDYITKTTAADNNNNNSSNNGESSNNGGTVNPPSQSIQNAVVNLALSQIGKPYVWGAEGPNSFDCSGLVYYVYKNAAGVNLPRTSRDQSKVGTTIDKSQLQPGDLIFSSTDGSGNVSHVGIYIGNNEMVHSPQPGENVQKTNINSSYWNKTYLWAKRVL